MPQSELVLVTGAAGFIGSQLVTSLRASGKSVICVDELSYFSARTELRQVPFEQLIHRDQLFSWLESHRPKLDALYHLGACTDTTEMDEAYLTRLNLEYSQKIWHYCARTSTPLVYASSAATYGDGKHGYDDDETALARLVPLNPYGNSKHLFDLWALSQEAVSRPPTWSGFKFFNVYGFGERHKEKMASVILHAYDQISAAGVAKLFKSYRPDIADGEQKRDFVAVSDVISVLRFAAEAPISRGIFNLGTGTARSFLSLANGVFAAMSLPAQIQFIDMPEALRSRYQYFTEAPMAKLRSAGYRKEFLSLEVGILEYVDKLRNISKAQRD